LYYFFQIIYLVYHKPNGGINIFKMKHKKLFNLISYVYVKTIIFYNRVLGTCTFWSNLPCLDAIVVGYYKVGYCTLSYTLSYILCYLTRLFLVMP